MYATEVMLLTVPRKRLLFGSLKVYALGILVRRSGSMNKGSRRILTVLSLTVDHVSIS